MAQLQSARFAFELLIVAMAAHGRRTLLVSRHGVLHAPEAERGWGWMVLLQDCAIFAIGQQGKRHDKYVLRSTMNTYEAVQYIVEDAMAARSIATAVVECAVGQKVSGRFAHGGFASC